MNASRDTASAMRQTNTGRLLMNASRAYSDRAMTKLRSLGHSRLSLAHAAILPFIEEGGTRMSALAEQAGITRQSASQLVLQLEEAGYIKRDPDPEDARAQRVRFTEIGHQFLRDAYAVKMEMEEEIVTALGKERAEALRDMLQTFCAR